MNDPIREQIAAACRACGVPELAERIRVVWRCFTARMGDARWDRLRSVGLIRLSVPLWPRASDEEWCETVIHEACHVIADAASAASRGTGRPGGT